MQCISRWSIKIPRVKERCHYAKDFAGMFHLGVRQINFCVQASSSLSIILFRLMTEVPESDLIAPIILNSGASAHYLLGIQKM